MDKRNFLVHKIPDLHWRREISTFRTRAVGLFYTSLKCESEGASERSWMSFGCQAVHSGIFKQDFQKIGLACAEFSGEPPSAILSVRYSGASFRMTAGAAAGYPDVNNRTKSEQSFRRIRHPASTLVVAPRICPLLCRVILQIYEIQSRCCRHLINKIN